MAAHLGGDLSIARLTPTSSVCSAIWTKGRRTIAALGRSGLLTIRLSPNADNAEGISRSWRRSAACPAPHKIKTLPRAERPNIRWSPRDCAGPEHDRRLRPLDSGRQSCHCRPGPCPKREEAGAAAPAGPQDQARCKDESWIEFEKEAYHAMTSTMAVFNVSRARRERRNSGSCSGSGSGRAPTALALASTAMSCLTIGKNRNTLELELDLDLLAVGPCCSLRPVAYPQPNSDPILHLYLSQ